MSGLSSVEVKGEFADFAAVRRKCSIVRQSDLSPDNAFENQMFATDHTKVG